MISYKTVNIKLMQLEGKGMKILFNNNIYERHWDQNLCREILSNVRIKYKLSWSLKPYGVLPKLYTHLAQYDCEKLTKRTPETFRPIPFINIYANILIKSH